MMRRTHSTGQTLALNLALLFVSIIASQDVTGAAQARPSSSKPSLTTLTPEKLFQRVSPSVFVVEGLRPDGRVLSQGSGVVVARGLVVTNRHVVERAARIRLRRESRTWTTSLAYIDPEHDLVQLRVSGLTAPAVPIRSSTTLQIGERVYAIGAPEGLELTLSEGLISSLRPYGKVQLIQTTAPISAGSSGGGLFDSQGRLVGLTTFRVKEGQNLNFAIPGEWIAALPIRPAGPPVAGGEVPPREDAVTWTQVGVEAWIAQDWAQAARAFHEAIRLKPDDAGNWAMLAHVYREQGLHASAMSAAREAVRLKPDSAEAQKALGKIYQDQKQFAEAIAAFREAARLDPRDSGAWVLLGRLYLDQKEFGDAVLAFNEALRLRPQDGWIWTSLGEAHLGRNDPSAGIVALREAIRWRRSDGRAWCLLGLAHRWQKQAGEAVQALRQCVRLEPERAWNWAQLGEAYDDDHDPLQAEAAFREAIRLDPTNEDAWIGLGNQYSSNEKYPEAISAYREAIRLKPEASWAWFGLGATYVKKREIVRALEVHEKLQALDPASALVLSLMIKSEILQRPSR
ncbi:MAG: hypothetical protein A3G35_05875 [candidate division NC10 bacterium RIFCSPLOWO2_12_FULL_66_18]|nr:MAG: hypothetical protein A3H39_12745 [candidate division NC10 bacterium RIFCSPLOWO2_02_FULL_66_22]OGC02078.1 MAG: hypothetical protein A3G35_05875 [candidate division NC10 bacterium RIFCSPLOWO2_12_FULL_66_18]